MSERKVLNVSINVMSLYFSDINIRQTFQSLDLDSTSQGLT